MWFRGNFFNFGKVFGIENRKDARKPRTRDRKPQIELLEERTVPTTYFFSNPGAITINDNTTATPYPSPINVNSLTGPVTNVTATIVNYSHTSAEDVGILLQGPSNNVELMANAGGLL